jgi:hypothetical protein
MRRLATSLDLVYGGAAALRAAPGSQGSSLTYGVSTRSAEDLVKAMGITAISKSQVSRL